jgi:hypothetical protein
VILVLRRRVLWTAPIVLCALALLIGPVSPASAEEVRSSQITAPGATSYPFDDEGAGTLTVAGKTTGSASASVDIGCYGGEEAEEFATLAEGVPVKMHKFSVAVALSKLPGYLCTLRAVQHGEEPEEPELAEMFTGPRVAPSAFALSPSSGYEALSDTLVGELRFEAADVCGLESNLYDPTSLLLSEELFLCAGYVEDEPANPSAGVRVDGAYGYGPHAALEVEAAIQPAGPLGAPAVAVTKSFDQATGTITIHEEDPIVRCEPESLPSPTKASCTSFAATGVSLQRTWETSDGDRVIAMTDRWVSTDGDAHALSFAYFDGLSAGSEGGLYELPGSSTFLPTTTGESVSLPTGASTIFYKTSPTTGEEEPEGTYPQGAIVYDSSPSEALGVPLGSSEGQSELELPYGRTIPAGGSVTLRTTFIQGFALPEVRTLARDALAGYFPADRPSVTIASPSNAATITSSGASITVSGTATDAVALSSFSVDEEPVPVGPDGAWSATVVLQPGTNTITALATNQLSATSSAAVTVDYAPPPPAPPPAPASPGEGGTSPAGSTGATTGASTSATPGASAQAGASVDASSGAAGTVHAAHVGAVVSAKGDVTLTLACQGAAGESCEVQTTLSTIETRRDGRVVAVSADNAGSTRLTVGTARTSIAAGHQLRIVVVLDAIGRRLLARFGKLPARLTASLLGSSGASRILSKSVTVTPPAKHVSH